jgi:ribokinase
MMKSDQSERFSPGRVTVFGSLNVDMTVRVERFPQPGETLSGSELVTAPGGKSSNQAVAMAALGSAVRLIGAVGDDANGRFLLNQAESAGVDVSGARSAPRHRIRNDCGRCGR